MPGLTVRFLLPAGAVTALLLAGCATPVDEPTGPGNAATSPATPESTPGPFPPFTECERFTPAVLPSGAAPGEPRPWPEENPRDFYLAWGEEHDQVVVGWGQEMLDDRGGVETREDWPFRPGWPENMVVVKDGVERYVVPVGDPPAGPIDIEFVIDGCPYAIRMAAGEFADGEVESPGYTEAEAIAYAGQF